jgi:hypothetical protein
MLRCKVFASIGVRGVARVVAGIGACVALLLAAASAQATFIPGTREITCEENSFAGEEVPNNVTVAPGSECAFVRGEGRPTIVDGNVTVGRGARLLVFGSVLKGNLSAEGAEQVDLLRSVVEGNASFDETSGKGSVFCDQSVCLLGSAFGRNVSITKSLPAGTGLAENFIAGDLTCNGNASVTNFGFVNTVLGQELGQCVGL